LRPWKSEKNCNLNAFNTAGINGIFLSPTFSCPKLSHWGSARVLLLQLKKNRHFRWKLFSRIQYLP